MRASIEQFLEHVARRGSWVGGGSVAALSAALSAALLEKLVPAVPLQRRLRAIRHDALRLIDRDAVLFARVIQATRAGGHRRQFVRALQSATDVPCRVAEHAGAVAAACRRARRDVRPKFQPDLHTAEALAAAAETSARALIATNLAWLKDAAYAKIIRRRLKAIGRPHAR